MNSIDSVISKIKEWSGVNNLTLIRCCDKCQKDLALEPAIKGLRGKILCFRCRYKLDKAGGERFLHDDKIYPERDAAWQLEFGHKRIRQSWIIDGLLAVCSSLGFKSAQKFRVPLPPQKPIKNEQALRSMRQLLFDGNPEADLNAEFLYYKPASPQDSYAPPDWNFRRRKCLERDEYCCQLCQNSTDLDVHHVIPRSRDGSHSLQNLITLCVKCHGEQKYYGHDWLISRNHEEWRERLVKHFLKEKRQKPRIEPENQLLLNFEHLPKHTEQGTESFS
jgi:HNH endonuclease